MDTSKEYDHRKIINLYKFGFSGNDIAEMVGCSHQTVYRVTSEYGVERDKLPPYRIKLQRNYDKLTALHDHLGGIDKVANRLGYSPEIVEELLNIDPTDYLDPRVLSSK